MPDTPRTVRAWLGGLTDLRDHDDTRRCAGWLEMQLEAAGILDALIGCQGRVVYTEEDVEAVRAALAPFIYGKEFADLEFLDSDSVGENKLLPMARAAITAAGGVVAEEVRTFAGYEKASLKVTKPREVVGIPLKVHPGDILYIVRAKEE